MASGGEYEEPQEEEEEEDEDEDELDPAIVAELCAPNEAVLLKIAIDRAARDGERGVVQELVEAGAGTGNALHAAAEGGHEEIASDLLENGVSVTTQDRVGNTPLHCAAQAGNTEMLLLLLRKGAGIDAMNHLGCTPLYLAAECGHAGAALALMAAGADIARRGLFSGTVLQAATDRGDLDVMRAAIEHGADLDVTDRKQRTPLHAAVSANNSEAIDLLVEAGANIEALDHEFGSTPLHAAARNIKLGAVLTLLRHGANINTRDMFEDTPLHSAAFMAGLIAGAPDVVDALLKSGADETTVNDGGSAAADLTKESVEDPILARELEHVRELLANAATDRAWRRRGYLVLCRAHADRMRQMQDTSSAHAGTAPTTGGGAMPGRTEDEANRHSGAEEASPVDERGGGGWAVVVEMVLRSEEEGVFRKMVGYLCIRKITLRNAQSSTKRFQFSATSTLHGWQVVNGGAFGSSMLLQQLERGPLVLVVKMVCLCD